MAQQRHPETRPAPSPAASLEASSEASFEMTFDGAALTARRGQSVGAALTDHGVRSWCSTRKEGAPRGLFCGIGVCYDCLITVDGVPNQRACLVPAREGMELSSAPPALPLPEGPAGETGVQAGERGERP